MRATEELRGHHLRSEEPSVRLPGRRKHRERLDYIAEAFADKLVTSVKISLVPEGKMTIEFANDGRI